jgi:AcrR family transcriptional regulator
MAGRPDRGNSRERILAAAAEIVGQVGSGRLTLDAVAERAGISKGGLLYNFPSKDALLQGMIQRLIDEAAIEKERLRRAQPDARNLEARLTCGVALKLRSGPMRDIATGMLAASAENPRLLDPIRAALATEWNLIKTTSENPADATLAWLALEGLTSLELHAISPISESERDAIVASALALLDGACDAPARAEIKS